MRDAGVDAVAVGERADLRGRDDDELLDAAAAERRVLVTRDVGTVRSLLRQRWSAERPTWGAILVAPTVPHGRSANAYVTGRLVRIVREHRGEDAVQQEIWIPAPPL